MFYVKYISIINKFFNSKKKKAVWLLLSSRSLALGRSHVMSIRVEKYYGRKLKPPVHSYISELAADPPAPAKCAETVAPAELTA